MPSHPLARPRPQWALTSILVLMALFGCEAKIGQVSDEPALAGNTNSTGDPGASAQGGFAGSRAGGAAGSASAAGNSSNGGASAAGASGSAGAGFVGITCDAAHTLCGSSCVDTSDDDLNCGGCGKVCAAGMACQNGQCACAGGELSCNGACVDGTSNAEHCGGCSTACAPGQVCTGGSCQCQAGLAACGGACVDLTSAAQHCGTCTNSCPTGNVCSNSACATSCAGGQTGCSGSCVNVTTDVSNCGACGKACPTGQTCSAGQCQCASGQKLCGTECVDAQTDAANCGACGKACAAGQACSNGACACPSGQTLCNGQCVDTSTSTANCGACGKACAAGATCAAGTCSGGGSTSGKVFSQCRFHFGAIDSFATKNSLPSQLDYFTPGWMGTSDTFDQSAVCTEAKGTLVNQVPVIVAYVAAFYAKRHDGLCDCNVTTCGTNNDLCHNGAAYISQNLNAILAVYKSYAQGYASCYGTTKPIVFEMEPDFYQYTGSAESSPWSASTAASIMKQFVTTIKTVLPNAVFSMDISPWVSPNNGGDNGASWYGNFDMTQFTFVNTSGGSTDATSTKIRSANAMTWAGVSAATGKPILADTGYGVNGSSAGPDPNWDSVTNIDARMKDGVVGICQYNPSSSWNTTISGIRSQLGTPKFCP